MEAKLKRHMILADTRRTLVLEAAKSAFVQVGLERTSMREIAKRSGYTPGALYAFFSSKNDVLRSLLAQRLGLLMQPTTDSGLPASVLFTRAAEQVVWRLLGADAQAAPGDDFAASQTDLFA